MRLGWGGRGATGGRVGRGGGKNEKENEKEKGKEKGRGKRAGAEKAAEAGRLVEVADMRGDLHMHTTASDGSCSIEEMVAEAKRRGYQYMAITDHSKSQFQ